MSYRRKFNYLYFRRFPTCQHSRHRWREAYSNGYRIRCRGSTRLHVTPRRHVPLTDRRDGDAPGTGAPSSSGQVLGGRAATCFFFLLLLFQIRPFGLMHQGLHFTPLAVIVDFLDDGCSILIARTPGAAFPSLITTAAESHARARAQILVLALSFQFDDSDSCCLHEYCAIISLHVPSD